MKDINYRGQSISNNSWVYRKEARGISYIRKDYTSQNSYIGSTIVKPSSICQYLNKNDINDNMLFEGDIVNFLDKDNNIIITKYLLIKGTSCMCYPLEKTKDIHLDNGVYIQDYYDYKFEIIGNIYDDYKELIK